MSDSLARGPLFTYLVPQWCHSATFYRIVFNDMAYDTLVCAHNFSLQWMLKIRDIVMSVR